MSLSKYLPLIAICTCFMCCAQKKSNPSNLFGKGVSLGVNRNGKLEEASGLVESIRQPGYFWTHNDSGNPPEIYLLDKEAKTKRVFTLANTKNRDWEDITIGSGPEEGVSYLYIGDIGDNSAKYPLKFIYRVKEPAIDDDKTITAIDKLIVRLDDGQRDTETIMFDPQTKNLYLVSKREAKVMLYEIASPFTADTVVARNVAMLPFTFVDGGAISPDGKEVLLRTYTEIYYWKKKGNESIVDLLKTPPTELPYEREPQGEAIAWARDGSGYYTISENAKGARGKLFFYKRN